MTLYAITALEDQSTVIIEASGMRQALDEYLNDWNSAPASGLTIRYVEGYSLKTLHSDAQSYPPNQKG